MNIVSRLGVPLDVVLFGWDRRRIKGNWRELEVIKSLKKCQLTPPNPSTENKPFASSSNRLSSAWFSLEYHSHCVWHGMLYNRAFLSKYKDIQPSCVSEKNTDAYKCEENYLSKWHVDIIQWDILLYKNCTWDVSTDRLLLPFQSLLIVLWPPLKNRSMT